MGWKSTKHVTRAFAMEFIVKSIRYFNDATVRDYIERLVEFRCSNKILGSIMDELVDKLHEHEFDDGCLHGYNFTVSEHDHSEGDY